MELRVAMDSSAVVELTKKKTKYLKFKISILNKNK